MKYNKEGLPFFPVNTEVAPGLSTKEVSMWLTPFEKGQRIFNCYVGNHLPNPPIHLAQAHGGSYKKVCYVEGKGIIVVTFQVIKDLVNLIKNCHGLNIRGSNAHLIRLGLCTTPEALPIFTGIEENAHAYFDQVVKLTLKPEEIVFTGKHDGSDSSEEFAFLTLTQILLTNPNLPVFPLPSNFHQL